MRTAISESSKSEKKILLTKVFSDPQDPRIDFFCNRMSLLHLEALTTLRDTILDGAEISTQFSLNNYYFSCGPKHIRKNDRCSSDTILPAVDMACFGTLFDIVVHGKQTVSSRTLWQGGKLVRHHVSRTTGIGTGLAFLLSAIGLFVSLYEKARQQDEHIAAEATRNRASGICESVMTNYGAARFSLIPGKECGSRKYVLALSYMAFLLIFGGCLGYFYIQNKHLFKYMQKTCDSAAYDALLNQLLFPMDRPSIDWSQSITVNGAPCTLRIFVLILLLCFDDRMHRENNIFSQLITALDAGQTQFTMPNQATLEIETSYTLRPR